MFFDLIPHWHVLPTAGIFEAVKLTLEDWALPPLQQWLHNVQLCFATFLQRVKAEVIDMYSLHLASVYISYVKPTVVASQHLDIEAVVSLLKATLTLLGFPTSSELLPTDAPELCSKLSAHSKAVLLCTREYAECVSLRLGMKEEIVAFGKAKLDALHTLLLYEGRFADAASKVIDRNFLARLCNPLVDVSDPVISVLRFVDVFTLLSGSQGLGILPDLLDLELDLNFSPCSSYQYLTDILQKEVQTLTVDLRLRTALLRSYHHNPLVIHKFDIPTKAQEEAKKAVGNLINSTAVTSLLLCSTPVDTALINISLEQELIQHSWRCISIACSDYPGKASHQCVAEELLKIGIKSHSDTLSVHASQLVLIFKGYDSLGLYDNLYVKNRLATWPKVKVLVTCHNDAFQHRSYASSFLADPTVPRMDSLQTAFIPSFSSDEITRKFAATVTAHNQQQQAASTSYNIISSKLRSQRSELSAFLREANHLLVSEGVLHKELDKNPRIFISYAWEQSKDLLHDQQKLLRQIVADLQTLGFPVWLDVERMTGDIDQQMAGNIANSAFALVIGTPLYCTRAEEITNVKKEFVAILAKENHALHPLNLLPVQFGESGKLPAILSARSNIMSIRYIKHFRTYSDFLTAQLIPQLLTSTNSSVSGKLHSLLLHLEHQLHLLPGKHLVVEHNQDMVQSYDMDNRLEGHIPTFGLAGSNSPIETRYDLKQRLEQFLSAPATTFVVFGDAGSGKSLFALSTFKHSLQEWHQYRKGGYTSYTLPHWLPVYIPLKSHACDVDNLLSKTLKEYELDDEDIQALRFGLGCNQKVLFILDGYDELGRGSFPNLPQILSEWQNAKLVITSRPEHFESELQHAASFALRGANNVLDIDTFEVHCVSPFVRDEIKRYVSHHHKQPEETYKFFQELPGLLEILVNPFLLNLTLQSLHQLQKNFDNYPSAQRVTKTAIYQAFSEYWFGKEAFKRSVLERDCSCFAQELAFSLFACNTTKVSLESTSLFTEFFGSKFESVRFACPLRRNNQEYTFLHKSLLEFFAARHLWSSLLSENADSIWNKRMLTDEPAIIDFLVEMNHPHKQQTTPKLLPMVYTSRENASSSTAASNAITVLNASGFCFSGMDLRNIRIPRADLGGALMHSTLLSGSDLQGVQFSHSLLCSSDLSGANLADSNLGEYPMLQHDKPVTCISYRPCGDYIATSAGQICLWSLESSRCVRQEEELPLCLAFSPDGSKIAFGTIAEVRLWDIKSGHQQTLPAVDQVHAVAFAADGSQLAFGNGTLVVVWNLQTGAVQNLYGHTNVVTSVAFSPDGFKLASACQKVKVWDVRSGNHQTLAGVNSAVFSPDGSKLAFGNHYNMVIVWDLESGRCRTLRGHTDEVQSVAFSPDGSKLASASKDKTVKVWNLRSNNHQTLRGHSGTVCSVVFSPDGSKLASGSLDKTVKMWDLKSRIQPSLQGYHNDIVTCVAFSPDGSNIASSSFDCRVHLYNLDSANLHTVQGHTDVVRSVAFSPDGSRLALGGNDCRVHLYDLASGNLQTLNCQRGSGHSTDSEVHSVAFSPNGSKIASASQQTVKVWNLNSGKYQILQGNAEQKTVAFSPDGCKLASGSFSTVNVWDLENGSYRALKGHHLAVRSVAFSPDGSKLASGSVDKTVNVWDLESGNLQTLQGHTGRVYTVAFSPDGSKLASGGEDCTVRVWDLQGGNHQTLLGHKGPVNSVAFSPFGFKLASGSDDNNVLVWQQVNHLSGASHRNMAEWVITFVSNKCLDLRFCNLDGVRGLSTSNQLLFAQFSPK